MVEDRTLWRRSLKPAVGQSILGRKKKIIFGVNLSLQA